MKKVLVLGATGMAGHLISLYLSEQKYDVITLSNTEFPFLENIICDVTNIKRLTEIIENGNYDVIINCIGILNQSAEDNKELSIFLNSFLPHKVVSIIRNSNTRFIHMSTDCVFSGEKSHYDEDSFGDGTTFYDRTKALGEINDSKNLTFRNSIIGPDMNPNGIGLFNWFMKQEGVIEGFSGVLWTGVTTLTLAKAMDAAIKYDLSGTYNLVNNNVVSKYDMLKMFNTYRKNKLEIKNNRTIKISKILKNNRQESFSFIVPSYEQMIYEMFDWINKHKDLYGHYKNKISERGILNESNPK
ncbi:sugar nucleotide-binding protein [Acholeplasma vituli]|uniref:dTDP-4-dehydrorhamnose reductase n=1 Tax=Paracholeplasma vituli TaxID=69473 RepID=A0ABT2PT95_9MOLU|nr:sugar nucleotide-binding protein [Paracholeplasma vituli]MCU0104169.1 sugar nucleotide-binding protein [Paracholeplasma vituli]